MTTNFITSCGKCGRDVESLGPPLIWSDQHGHICYGCHTDSGPIPQGGQKSKNCGGEELKDMPPAPTTCEMVFVPHPDDPAPDRICGETAIGRTEDKVYVCEKCAVNALREMFAVFPLDHVFVK